MNYKEAKNVKIGDILKRTSKHGSRWYGGNNIKVGTEFRVKFIDLVSGTFRFYNYENTRDHNSQYCTSSEVVLISSGISSIACIDSKIESLNNSISKLKDQIKDEQSKRDFLMESKQETFRPTEFKAWRILKIIEDNLTLSTIEKAKLIAEIVDNK